MIKRILASVFLLVLLTVAVVQAMEKVGPEDKLTAASKSSVEKIPGLGIGLKAPDFALETLDGKTVKLSDFQGKKVMLNFWATWCPPCKSEMPDMQKFYTEAGNDITILAVNIDPEYDVAGFAKEMNITFPILLDKEDKVMNMYQILTIPTTFFIDEKGLIQNKFMGAMTFEQMKKFSDEL